jgi:hypothetical protein
MSNPSTQDMDYEVIMGSTMTAAAVLLFAYFFYEQVHHTDGTICVDGLMITQTMLRPIIFVEVAVAARRRWHRG